MSDDARSAEKPTEEWVTGDEPMTGPQSSYLETLAREAGVEVPDGLTKAKASEMIDELQGRTGRGSTTTSNDAAPTNQPPEQPTDAAGPTEFGATGEG